MTAARESELVAAHRRGDPEALAELLGAYQKRIYAICYRMIRDDQTARDLTQDVLVKVIENLESYNGRARLSTWVIRIAMNVCLSHLRRERLRRHAPLEEPSDTPRGGRAEPSREGEQTPAGSVEQAEVQEILVRAMDSLDPEMRSILVLRDLQELDYHCISEVLDIPVGTVKSRLFRARRALREAVGGRTPPYLETARRQDAALPRQKLQS
jgi:RNA polymerase sigma-70 factor (ECF subfamily)